MELTQGLYRLVTFYTSSKSKIYQTYYLLKNNIFSNVKIIYRTPQKHELQKICSEYLSTVIDDKSEIITNAIVDLLVKVFLCQYRIIDNCNT